MLITLYVAATKLLSCHHALVLSTTRTTVCPGGYLDWLATSLTTINSRLHAAGSPLAATVHGSIAEGRLLGVRCKRHAD